jgi:hypothetical protein
MQLKKKLINAVIKLVVNLYFFSQVIRIALKKNEDGKKWQL